MVAPITVRTQSGQVGHSEWSCAAVPIVEHLLRFGAARSLRLSDLVGVAVLRMLLTIRVSALVAAIRRVDAHGDCLRVAAAFVVDAYPRHVRSTGRSSRCLSRGRQGECSLDRALCCATDRIAAVVDRLRRACEPDRWFVVVYLPLVSRQRRSARFRGVNVAQPRRRR